MHRETTIKNPRRVLMHQESLLEEKPNMIGGILWVSKKMNALEDIVVIVGLVAVQFLYAGNSILLSYILKFGVQPSSLIILSSFATFLLLSPLSIVFERRLWPKGISCKLFCQLLLLAFGGVTVFQYLFMKGVSLTSPALATAMPNLAPGLIFIIAWALRLEKIKIGCIYSRAKIVGTVLCVFGALGMSLMQSFVQVKESSFSSPATDNVALDSKTIVGCIYLIAAVFVLSSQVILQAITLRDFPAPLTLCSLTSLIGVLTTSIVKMFEDHNSQKPEWPLLTTQEIVVYAILVGSLSALCVSFNAWAMKKRGPVIVSIFNPLGTVISTIFSVITLEESIGVGSLGGMCLMFTGLYFVLWAKRKEDFAISNNSLTEPDMDVEKPLLV